MEREFERMSEEQQARLAELWAKCCDIRQPMSEQEMSELWELLGLEAQEFDRMEA